MSKARSQSLDTVRKLAERAEQDAARQLEQQQLVLRQEQAQAGQIAEYHRDYIQVIDSQTSLKVDELIAYRHFAQNLSRTVEQMQLKVSRLEIGLEKSRDNWRQLRQRRIAIEDLIARAKLEEGLALDKVEQKMMDDLVTQQVHRRMAEEQNTED